MDKNGRTIYGENKNQKAILFTQQELEYHDIYIQKQLIEKIKLIIQDADYGLYNLDDKKQLCDDIEQLLHNN